MLSLQVGLGKNIGVLPSTTSRWLHHHKFVRAARRAQSATTAIRSRTTACRQACHGMGMVCPVLPQGLATQFTMAGQTLDAKQPQWRKVRGPSLRHYAICQHLSCASWPHQITCLLDKVGGASIESTRNNSECSHDLHSWDTGNKSSNTCNLLKGDYRQGKGSCGAGSGVVSSTKPQTRDAPSFYKQDAPCIILN